MLRSILTLFLYSLATFPTAADTLVSRDQRPVALVREDGTVWMEDKNGETLTGLIGTRVPELEEIIFVSAGARHFLALDKAGRVWAWGDNQAGQLGDGGTRASTTPRRVASLRGIVGIAAGDWHSLAVDGTGRVWAWGSDSLGQLGSGQAGAFRYSTTPSQVSGLPPLRALAAGTAHSLGLASDGTVWSWGAAPEPAGSRHYKAQVPELSGIAEINARGDASYARGKSGQEWGWGRLSDEKNAALPVSLPTGSFADARAQVEVLRSAGVTPASPPALRKPPALVVKAGEAPALRKPAVLVQAGKAGETPALQKPPVLVVKAGETPALQKPAARTQVEVLSNAGVTPALPRAPAEVKDAGKDAGATSPAAVAVPEATAPLTLEGTVSLTGGLFGQGHGMVGVRIVGKGANCTTTDAQGRFTCQVAAGWSGRLSPTKRHYRFSPGAFTYRQLNADMAQQDFTASYEPE